MFILNLLVFKTFLYFVSSEKFEEELFVKPLGSSHLYAYFQFITLLDSENTLEHTKLLPRTLGEVISNFHIDELHLSLTEGQWRHEQWGYPVIDAAPGAELFSRFKEDVTDIDTQWKKLSETMSGLFCASLNFIDNSNTISPKMTLFQTSPSDSKNITNDRLRYATLPREIVCTENLTPWKKLLPCESERGLATLLNSRMIHNTNYHSIGLHVRRICSDESCMKTQYEIKQTVSLAYDLSIIGSRDWSFRKLFGQGLAGKCPLAENSRAFVDITLTPDSELQLMPKPDEIIYSSKGGAETKVALYNFQNSLKMINIAAKYTNKNMITVPTKPPIYFSRYIIGYGQEFGGIVTEITNNHYSQVNVILMENAPWWLPIQMSSLRVNGEANSKIIAKQYFSPGRSRVRPYHLELLLKLPPKSTTVVSIDFEYVFLKWQEYPPDANHAFYIGSALISVLLPSAKNYTGIPVYGSTIMSTFNASQPYYVGVYRTAGAAVSLPTPDFSMPYNVICLACTIVALAFGPLHNICTKRLMLQPQNSGQTIVQKLKNILKFKKSDKNKIKTE